MNHICLGDIVFQIATGAIGQAQVQRKVQDSFTANWEATVRGQERARIKKEQTEVVGFDDKIRDIIQLFRKPIPSRKVYTEVVNRHKKMFDRINEIRERGGSPHTNTETRANALEALAEIAHQVIDCRATPVGRVMLDRWVQVPVIERGMTNILTEVSNEERGTYVNRLEIAKFESIFCRAHCTRGRARF